MSIADFHSHTNHSDGVLSPSELINLAKDNKVKYLAITDHDTVDGIQEAKKITINQTSIKIISGIELSVDLLNEDIHILGIGIDESNQQLITELRKLKEARESRAKQIIEKLYSQGIKIEIQKIKENIGKATIGRPHIAQEMINKKYVNTVQEAFDNFGWHGFLIANFGEGYGEQDLRSERLGGLSITYNPDFKQSDIDINCQTLGNRKYNLPPEMYAGKRGNYIFEQVNIKDLRVEFFQIVNNQFYS